MTPDGGLFAALTRQDLPRAFERWRIVIPAGATRPTDAAEWAGCLVLVERGTMEVDCAAGGCRHFTAGDLLALGWLPLRSIRNTGAAEVRLLAVRRRGRAPTSAFLHVARSDPREGADRETDT